MSFVKAVQQAPHPHHALESLRPVRRQTTQVVRIGVLEHPLDVAAHPQAGAESYRSLRAGAQVPAAQP